MASKYGIELKFAGSSATSPKAAKGKRGTVAVKYRHPENSALTWTGRGLQPRWLKAALAAGAKLSDFTTDAPTNQETRP